MEYGLISDWFLIKDYYGVKNIGGIASTLRDLDEKNPFIHIISGRNTQRRIQMLHLSTIDTSTLELLKKLMANNVQERLARGYGAWGFEQGAWGR